MNNTAKRFRLGPWTIDAERGEITDSQGTQHLEPKVMAVLLCLAENEDAVVTKQQLVDTVWNGRPVSDEVISRCISALRTHLGDDHKAPKYIRTFPKRGYRLVPDVEPVEAAAQEPSPVRKPDRRPFWFSLLGLAAIGAVYFAFRASPQATFDEFQSIAVLPFTNMSQEPDQYLADGVTEELTYALTQLPNLKVAARTSAFQFRGTALDVREIGRRIEVDGVIEGSVRREGNRLRVTAQLIDTRSGYNLWGATFDGDVSEVFQLQQQVAERVRDSLGRTEHDTASATVSRPARSDAYDLFLRGRYALNRRGAASLAQAVRLFEQAIELDPAYGPAYLELANTYLLLPSYSTESSEAMYEAAIETVNRGVGSDPSIAEAAAAVQGYIEYKRGNWMQADRAYRSALRARHVSSTTYQWYSSMLAGVGRLDDALVQVRHAKELDPLSPVVISRLAITSLWADDNETAEMLFPVAIELGLRGQLHTDSYMLLLIRRGRFEEARAMARGPAPDAPDNPTWFDYLLDCIGKTEHCGEAGDALAAAESVSPRVQLIAWALLGNNENVKQVARMLEDDVAAFDTELLFVDELKAFRRDPEFGRLLDAIGIADYWRQSGCTWNEIGVSCGRY